MSVRAPEPGITGADVNDLAIWLDWPKYAHNVGGAVRAASIVSNESPYEGDTDPRALVVWSGDRVMGPKDEAGLRLPREERMRAYRDVSFHRVSASEEVMAFVDLTISGFIPVCVEFDASAEYLTGFEHPERPLYVFGPEDGSVAKWLRAKCHRFVTIPSKSCLNLAAAVNVVLYDRMAKGEAG